MAVQTRRFQTPKYVALMRRSFGRYAVIKPNCIGENNGIKLLYRDAGFFQVFSIFIPSNDFTLPDRAAITSEPVGVIEKWTNNRKVSYIIMLFCILK